VTLLAKALGYWRAFASGSVNGRIFYAMTIIIAASFGVKLAMIGKDIVIAGSLGLGDALDAFLIALVVPTFAEMVLAQSFAAAFMPAYIRVQEHEGPAAAKRFFAHAMFVNLCLLSVSTVLLALAGEPLLHLVAARFSPAKLALAHDAYLAVLLMVPIFGQLSLWGAVLNAGEKFALVALSPILTPLITIAVVTALGREAVSVHALAWATVAGCAAELVAVGAALHRRGLLPAPRWRGERDAGAGQVLGQYIPLVLSAIIMGSSPVIDQSMASWLGSGNVAALNYGTKIPGILTGIGVTAMGTAVLPHFSRLVAVNDYATLRHTLGTYARWIVILSIPVTAAFIASSHWIVQFVFERGAFGPEDTALVSRIQQMYLVQVPFFVLGILGVRALVAMSKNHLLTIMSLVNVVVNVVGNVIFMGWFGVSGIALSTSVVYVVSMTMIWILVHRNLVRLRVSGLVAP
jgi:putative peptidoglycan lipid II flippase